MEPTHVAVPAIDGTLVDREVGLEAERAERIAKYNAINAEPYVPPMELTEFSDEATVIANQSDPVKNDNGVLLGAPSIPTFLFGIRFLANWSIPNFFMHIVEFATLVVLAMSMSTGVGTLQPSLGTWAFWVIWASACAYFAFWAVAIFSRSERGSWKTRRRSQLEQYLAFDIFHLTQGTVFYVFATAGTAILYLSAPPPYDVVTQTSAYIAQQLFFLLVAISCSIGLGTAALRNTIGLTAVALVRYRALVPVRAASTGVASVSVTVGSSASTAMPTPTVRYESTRQDEEEESDQTDETDSSDEGQQKQDEPEDEEQEQTETRDEPKSSKRQQQQQQQQLQSTSAPRTAPKQAPVAPKRPAPPRIVNQTPRLATAPPVMLSSVPKMAALRPPVAASKGGGGSATSSAAIQPPLQAILQRRPNATRPSEPPLRGAAGVK